MANFGYKGFSLSDSPSLNETPFHAPRPPLPEYRRPLEPEAAESFTRGLVNRGTSGLSYVMSSLDKPGRAVRGVLAGKPREALAAIPFSDTLGITDPDKAVSGRKLLTQHGILESGDKSWGATAAGLAAEYATDPLNLITLGTGGAVTRLGRATKNAGEFKNLSRVERLKGFDGIEPTLRAAGHDTERLVNQGQRLASQEVVDAAGKVGAKAAANQPLAGLVGIGLPFRDPSLVLGTGKLAQSVAGFADRTGSAIAKTAPVRYARAAFDPSVRDAVGPAGQSAMSRYGVPAGHAAAIKARASHASLIDKVDAGLAAGIPERDLLSAARETGEGVPLAHHTPEAYAAAHPIGSQVRSIQDEHRALAEKLGYHSELNDPFAAHVPRGAVAVGEHARGLRPDTNFPTAGINQRHRQNELREIPGGTEAFNRWAADHAGGDIGTVTAAVDADVNATLQRIGVSTLPPEVLAGIPGKVNELAAKISGLDPKYRSAQHGPFAGGLTEPGYGTYFDPNLVGDMEQYAGTNKNLIESTSAVHGAVHQNVRPIQPGDVNLHDFYRSLGLKTTKPDPITGTPMKGALVEGLKKAAIAGAPDINPMLLGKRQDLINLARQYGIPAEVAAEFSKQYPKWAAPNTVAGPVKAVDTLTNLFKNLTYSIWPTSHVRNASSALTNNLMYGSGLDNHALAMRVMRDTATAAEIQAAHPGMPAGLADDAARKWIKAQAYANANTFGVHNQATDLAGGPARFAAGNRITPKLPGEGRTGPTGSLLGDIAHLGKEAVVGKPGETSPFDVLGQAGVGGKTVDTWSPLAAGRTAGTNIEDYFRLSNYLGNVKQGMAPAEAGSAVNKLHFDYTNATQFEKNVMRRLVPFYTFQSRNLPLQLDRLIHRPSAISAQLRPFARTEPGQYTPDHIASGVAIPTGPEKDGNQQFISQLGLPVEEAFERLKFKDNLPDIKGTALAYMGGMNPLIKGPLEQLFDTQFHTGRKLSDLHAPAAASAIGKLFGDDNPQLFSQIVANSPVTRIATAYDKAWDERKPLWAKALNLGTGVRVTDVDMNKARAVESRKALEEMLMGSPNVNSYTNFYVRPENQGGLTPEETSQMQMLALLQQNAREYAEKKRQGLAP